MKKNIGKALALYPMPVVIVGAMVGDKPTWTLVAHVGIMGHDHVTVSLAAAHYINEWVKKEKVCSINLVDEVILAKADYCGAESGMKTDKSDVFTWTAGEAGAPIIDDAKLSMECRVEDIYETSGFETFIMTIANTYADESVLDVEDKMDYDVFKPILFEMPHYTYLKTGDTAAKCLILHNR